MPSVDFSEFAPAKVNLYLRVLGRRPDGYHRLDSLVVFAGAGDVLSAEPDQGLSLTLAGPFGDRLSAGPDNLVLRAARALAAAAGVAPRARLLLEKRLPVAAGIGGGSADAAAALRLLSRLWRVALPAARLAEIAAGLGADVPVCLAGQPARLGGIGERLDTAPALPAFGLALVNPGVALSTAAVFRRWQGVSSEPADLPDGWADADSLAAVMGGLGNSLEAPAMALCPVIAEVLKTLRATPGCLLARMSGSGATCYGLFGAQAAAAAVPARPGWWSWAGTTHLAGQAMI